MTPEQQDIVDTLTQAGYFQVAASIGQEDGITWKDAYRRAENIKREKGLKPIKPQVIQQKSMNQGVPQDDKQRLVEFFKGVGLQQKVIEEFLKFVNIMPGKVVDNPAMKLGPGQLMPDQLAAYDRKYNTITKKGSDPLNQNILQHTIVIIKQ